MIKNNKGFTMVELMIAICITVIVGVAIASFYQSNLRISRKQRLLNEMNQNIRSAIHYMEKEIQMAGYSPSGTANIGINNPAAGTAANSIRFRYVANADGFDNDGDGAVDNPGELADVQYSLDAANNLVREDFTGTPNEEIVIANDIENLEFFYNAPVAPVTSITVGISILARTSLPLPVQDRTPLIPPLYNSLSGADWTPVANFNNGRRLITTSVMCRNTGLL